MNTVHSACHTANQAVLQLFSITIIGDLPYEYSQRLTSLYADL